MQISTVEFFGAFVKETITEDQFVQELSKLSTQIQKKYHLTVEQIQLVAHQCSQIADEIFNRNIELWFKFALYLSNRSIYKVLLSFDINFDLINLAAENINENILALYLIKRVYHSENHKVLLIFLNSVIRGVRQIEKKMVLLEIYGKIMPQLEKRQIHLRDILPLVLMVMKESLEKYLKYKQSKQDNTLNEENEYVREFMQNFQAWTISYFQRIFEQLKKTPEIKSTQEQKVIKNLLTLGDLYEYDYTRDQLLQKPENPALSVKHLVLLFLFDLLEGIMEAKQTLSASQLDPHIIDELLSMTHKMIGEIHSDRLEIITNYLEFVQFSIQRNTPIVRQSPRYDLTMPYNCIAIASLVCSMFQDELKEDRNIKQSLSPQFKIRLYSGMFYEMKMLKEAKCDIIARLVKGVAQVLANEELPQQINDSTYFIVSFHEILLQILERAGSGVVQEQELMLLNAWKSGSRMFNIESYTQILLKCLKQSDNDQLIAHMINQFRSQVVNQLKNKTVTQEQWIRQVDILAGAIVQKTTIGTIDKRIQIVDSLVLIFKQLALMNPKCEQLSILQKKYSPTIQKFNKAIQLQIDYLNSNQVGEVQESIAQQKQLLSITYYNIQDIL